MSGFEQLFPGRLPRLVMFDLDGTLVDSVPGLAAAVDNMLLKLKGLDGFFDVVYGGDSLPRKKPDPLPLQTVCADFDLPPAQVVAIGDSSNDAQAARAAGCPVLTVPYGYNHGQSIHGIDSDGIVDTLLDAASRISSQN